MKCRFLPLLAGWVLVATATFSPAAELTRLGPENWKQFAPRGKEVDCIYGDFVLRNDRIVCVVGDTVPTRKANMTVRNSAGCIIDLTLRKEQSDQLSCFYPGAGRYTYTQLVSPKEIDGVICDKQVSLTVRAPAADGRPQVEVTYTLADGWDYVLVRTRYTNRGEKPVVVDLADSLRADRTFERSGRRSGGEHWVYDRWFRQGYGFVAPGAELVPAGNSRYGGAYRYVSKKQPKGQARLQPGESVATEVKVVPAGSLFALQQKIAALQGRQLAAVELKVQDPDGQPVSDVNVAAYLLQGKNKRRVGHGYTDAQGHLAAYLPQGKVELILSAPGRGEKTITVSVPETKAKQVTLPKPGYVVGRITNAKGEPCCAKVQFYGVGGTKSPYWGPDSSHTAVHNVVYAIHGRFRQPIAPGEYRVLISYGPEYDAVEQRIKVQRGRETLIEATMYRTVQTPGWISADFHNHASPSGDNTSSQFGRVQNLLCEHVEFAPCTEHNRLSSYTPHLKRMKAEHLMGTCVGIELTNRPGTVNHQNAFPLIPKWRTQDNGAPQIDDDPEVQIERLALWDDGSEKLVQQNHPDIGHLFYDRNADGKPDGGFRRSIPFIDVIEVHPLGDIVRPGLIERRGRLENNRIFNWLQLLNQGYRIPGVVNTDSHYNFHGSSYWRNYIRSNTDDPAKIKVLDVVHAAEAGHIVMTSAPFLEVVVEASGQGPKRRGIPGDDVLAPGKEVTVHVRVQCANWYDINRVQVYLNGRPAKHLNFTRETTPERFGPGVLKFDHKMKVKLQRDTHIVVLAIGQGLQLGDVLGPNYGRMPPVALSNPVFVDVDGNGFQANGDTLGYPLPVRGGRHAAPKK